MHGIAAADVGVVNVGVVGVVVVVDVDSEIEIKIWRPNGMCIFSMLLYMSPTLLLILFSICTFASHTHALTQTHTHTHTHNTRTSQVR